MKNNDILNRFENLTYESFRSLANDPLLSNNEKIGFPDCYRNGKDNDIFKDICSKLSLLQHEKKRVLDIGPGCGGVARALLALCKEQHHELILIDSPEMLTLLPSDSSVRKVPGFYPDECASLITELQESVDVILLYSVAQYLFVESNLFTFLDKTLGLLSHGGQLLIGDLPNISKRNRFLMSPSGLAFHKQYYGTESEPVIKHHQIQYDMIDDSIIMSIIMRCRQANFHAYIMPQASNLPMENRREDILIIRP